jgi:hypothetical protein
MFENMLRVNFLQESGFERELSLQKNDEVGPGIDIGVDPAGQIITTAPDMKFSAVPVGQMKIEGIRVEKKKAQPVETFFEYGFYEPLHSHCFRLLSAREKPLASLAIQIPAILTPLYHFTGHTNDCRIWGNILNDRTPGADHRPLAHLEPVDDIDAGANIAACSDRHVSRYVCAWGDSYEVTDRYIVSYCAIEIQLDVITNPDLVGQDASCRYDHTDS